MAFDNPMGYSLIIINVYAKFYQNILHGTEVIGPVSVFKNLDLGKAPTDDKWNLINLWGKT